MVINTTDSFLQALERSNLLDADQLAAAREAARQTNDPLALAKLLAQKGLLTRWQAGQLLIGRPSFFLGKYKLIQLLGQGGMGNVFLARHTMMNRTVAVKMISRQLSQNPASRDRFLEEARAVAALDHPNIVHAYTVDSEDGRYYMVLEYVEGQDLQRMVDAQGPLDYQQAVDFIRQAADGLAHAHAKGMVHCDIKPSNLLVNPQGVVKILDMGMARLIGTSGEGQEAEKGEQGGGHEAADGKQEAEQEDRFADFGGQAAGTSAARDERILGSVDYMAPEQGLQSPDLDYRADIYSLGCTLYCLLTGGPPFPEGTLPERILKHQYAAPPSILLKRPGAPRDLVKICEKMIAKEPTDRFQSAAEVSALLAAWRPPPKILKASLLDQQNAKVPPADGSAEAVAGEPRQSPARLAEQSPEEWFAESLADWHKESPEEDPKESPEEDLAESLLAKADAAAPRKRRKRGLKRWLRAGSRRVWILGSLGLLALAAVCVVVWPRSGRDETDTIGSTASGSVKPSSAATGSPTASAKAKSASNPPSPSKTAKPGEVPAPGAASGDSKSSRSGPGSERSSKGDPTRGSRSGSRKRGPTPPPVPRGDPFKDFPEAMDLPLKAIRPSPYGAPLASVHTLADDPWEMGLRGGDRALTGHVFTIQGARPPEKKPTWVVRLGARGRAKEEPPTDVAKFSREGEVLMFQWLAGAPAQADQLRNTALDLRAARTSRTLALRKPRPLDPVAVDLLRPATTAALALDVLPDPSCLRLEIFRLEIAGLESRDPQAAKPSGPVGLKTPVTLTFPSTDKLGRPPANGVEFKLQFVQEGSRLAIEARQSESQAAEFQAARPATTRPQIERDIRNLKESLSNLQSQTISAEQKKTLAAAIEQKLIANDAALWSDDSVQATHSRGRLHFRVLADLNGYQLELARTTEATASEKR